MTGGLLLLRPHPEYVPCPRCGAKIGAHCSGDNEWPHVERWHAYEAQLRALADLLEAAA